MQSKDTDYTWENLNSLNDLYKKINNLIKEKDNEFSLSLYSFDFSNLDLSYSAQIKLLNKIANFINHILNNKTKLFKIENNKIISLNNKTVSSQNIIENFTNKIFDIEDVEISLNPEVAYVEYPKDGNSFDQLLNKLNEKIKENKKDKNTVTFPSYPHNIIINKDGEFIESVEKASTQLYLIAKNNNIEIIKQNILADKTFQITGGAEGDFELFYILNGEISHEDGDTILAEGDSIIAKSGKEEKYFKTLTDVTLLYMTSTPIFASEQKRINDLISLNEQVAEKDVETNEHCKRLQDLSQLTAMELGLEEKKIFNLGYASFLHDIGKVKVPSDLLQKPGKLTKKEWETMKKHTAWGKEIILNQFSLQQFRKVAQIIYQHHERYDGTGYPQGLSGDDILIEAQILSVVDAYDAMTYERPYQRAFTREEALAEIKSEKGKQFSPKAVEAFLKAEKKYIQKNKN